VEKKHGWWLREGGVYQASRRPSVESCRKIVGGRSGGGTPPLIDQRKKTYAYFLSRVLELKLDAAKILKDFQPILAKATWDNPVLNNFTPQSRSFRGG